ncbi:MAG: hypothetical protein RL660_2600 [Bacteroidota bacterium]
MDTGAVFCTNKYTVMIIVYILLTLLVFAAMEGITWLTHRFVMHGFLWYLHEDHHNPGEQFFEKNDAFFLIFAIPSWLCIMLGLMNQVYWVVSIGAGIAMYGAAYFIVHDIIIHQRFKLFSRWNNTYVRAIRWAHKMHHKHMGKEHGESFGMLLVHKKYWDKVRREKQMNPSIR